jgi:hypothetical protein
MQLEEIGRWVFAIAKHLKVYAADPRLTYMFATRRSGADGELLLRLRGLSSINKQRLEAIAIDVNIAPQELSAAIERLEGTNLISVERSRDSQEILNVQETIFTEQEVYRATAELFETAQPRQAERAIIPLLHLMSRLPLTETEVIERICAQGFSEEDVSRALELQESFGLLTKQQVTDMGITLIYNEYLWGHKIERIGSIIAKLKRQETGYLLGLMDEVSTVQGLSLDKLTSAPPKIVAMAAQKGILDTTTIITSTNDQRTFAFSPHFYGYKTGTQPEIFIDPADQVKLFIASISYGVNFSKDFRLHSPDRFVRKLLREGEAGNATPILRDYVLLEKQGIVTVEERGQNRGTFVLKKQDVVERALEVMERGSLLSDEEGENSLRTLISQRDYRSPEYNRLRGDFGKMAGPTEQFDHDFLAAIREEAQKGNW